MLNWERDTLKNLYEEHKQIDWAEMPDNISEFFPKLPEIFIEERGHYLSVLSEDHELILGFGEYGGLGHYFEGVLYWQTYTHKEEPTNWEFGGEVPNGSPYFVWRKVYEELSRHIENMGAK